MPMRPGFGPGLKPLGRTPASRRHAGCKAAALVEETAQQPPRRRGIGTWALAAQLRFHAVRRTLQPTAIRRLPSDLQRVALRKLLMLDAVTTLEDLRVPPANRLEKLKGDAKGNGVLA
jgi:hypothetical protein